TLSEVGQLVVGRALRQERQQQRGVADRAERPPLVVALHGPTITGKTPPAPGMGFHIVERYAVRAAGTAAARTLNKLQANFPWGEVGCVPGLPAQPERQHAPARTAADGDPG